MVYTYYSISFDSFASASEVNHIVSCNAFLVDISHISFGCLDFQLEQNKLHLLNVNIEHMAGQCEISYVFMSYHILHT
jgi:hypothetical protein